MTTSTIIYLSMLFVVVAALTSLGVRLMENDKNRRSTKAITAVVFLTTISVVLQFFAQAKITEKASLATVEASEQRHGLRAITDSAFVAVKNLSLLSVQIDDQIKSLGRSAEGLHITSNEINGAAKEITSYLLSKDSKIVVQPSLQDYDNGQIVFPFRVIGKYPISSYQMSIWEFYPDYKELATFRGGELLKRIEYDGFVYEPEKGQKEVKLHFSIFTRSHKIDQIIKYELVTGNTYSGDLKIGGGPQKIRSTKSWMWNPYELIYKVDGRVDSTLTFSLGRSSN